MASEADGGDDVGPPVRATNLLHEVALVNQDTHDIAIIDKVDEIIVKHGVQYDCLVKRLSGFWDQMQTRCILLTASISKDLKIVLTQLCRF